MNRIDGAIITEYFRERAFNKIQPIADVVTIKNYDWDSLRDLESWKKYFQSHNVPYAITRKGRTTKLWKELVVDYEE